MITNRFAAMNFVELSDDMLKADASLVDFLLHAALESDLRFFELIGKNVRDHKMVASRLVIEHQSDLYGGLLAVNPTNGSFAGLMVSMPLKEVLQSQRHSLRAYHKAAVNPVQFRMAIKTFASRKMAIPDEDVLYLSRLYISKEYRGTGLSEQMLVHLINVGQRSGLKTCGLHVDASNLRAISLYLRTGFVLEAPSPPGKSDYFYMKMPCY